MKIIIMVGCIWKSDGYVGFYCNTTDSGYGPLLKFTGSEEEFKELWNSIFDFSIDLRSLPIKYMCYPLNINSRSSLMNSNELTIVKEKMDNEYKNIQEKFEQKSGIPTKDSESGWDFWINEWDWGCGFYDKDVGRSFGPVKYFDISKKELKKKWNEKYSDIDPRKIEYTELDRIFHNLVEPMS